MRAAVGQDAPSRHPLCAPRSDAGQRVDEDDPLRAIENPQQIQALKSAVDDRQTVGQGVRSQVIVHARAQVVTGHHAVADADDANRSVTQEHHASDAEPRRWLAVADVNRVDCADQTRVKRTDNVADRDRVFQVGDGDASQRILPRTTDVGGIAR